MVVRTASDVAELETEVVLLRSDNEALRRRVAVLEAENGGLKIENAKLDQRARDELRKSTEMETIINQTSMGLVSALQSYNRNRQIASQMRRAQQEDVLLAEGQPPAFLRRDNFTVDMPNPQPPYIQSSREDTEQTRRPTAEEDHEFEREEQDRQDRLRGSAERIAMAPPAVRPVPPMGRPTPRAAIVDHTLADRDPRMPAMGDYRPTTPPQNRADYDADQEALRDLAKRIG